MGEFLHKPHFKDFFQNIFQNPGARKGKTDNYFTLKKQNKIKTKAKNKNGQPKSLYNSYNRETTTLMNKMLHKMI